MPRRINRSTIKLAHRPSCHKKKGTWFSKLSTHPQTSCRNSPNTARWSISISLILSDNSSHPIDVIQWSRGNPTGNDILPPTTEEALPLIHDEPLREGKLRCGKQAIAEHHLFIVTAAVATAEHAVSGEVLAICIIKNSGYDSIGLLLMRPLRVSLVLRKVGHRVRSPSGVESSFRETR